ncbi:unnamed protein product [Withania somnifera]
MWEKWEEENDQCILKNYSDDLDLDIQNVLVPETAEPPSHLILPLLRYQKEWLAWSLKQEESVYRGGILEDSTSDSSISSSSPSTSQKLPVVKGTLVVCPMVGTMQWVRQIERCTTKGSNKTLVYNGTNREKLMLELAEYDFVITTYSTIKSDYRPKQSKQRIKNSKPQVEMLDQKTDSNRKLIDNVSVDNSASVGEDVSRRKSVLHSVKWQRIILDEASHTFTDSCIMLFSLIGVQLDSLYMVFICFLCWLLECHEGSYSGNDETFTVNY